jgi:hypothetical protein
MHWFVTGPTGNPYFHRPRVCAHVGARIAAVQAGAQGGAVMKPQGNPGVWRRIVKLLGQVLIVAGVMLLVAVFFILAIDLRILCQLRSDRGAHRIVGRNRRRAC